MAKQGNFKFELNKVADAIGEDVYDLWRQLSFEILQGVVQEHPVRTGYSKSNWFVGVNMVRTDVVGSKVFGPKRDPIEPGKLVIASAKNGQTINITNNVDYILELEDGFSRKAPKGMARITLRRLGIKYQNIANGLGPYK